MRTDYSCWYRVVIHFQVRVEITMEWKKQNNNTVVLMFCSPASNNFAQEKQNCKGNRKEEIPLSRQKHDLCLRWQAMLSYPSITRNCKWWSTYCSHDVYVKIYHQLHPACWKHWEKLCYGMFLTAMWWDTQSPISWCVCHINTFLPLFWAYVFFNKHVVPSICKESLMQG